MYIIWVSPKTPKKGYHIPTNFEKPIGEINIADMQSNIVYFLYFFSLFVALLKKPYPAEIADEKIALIITSP